MGKITDAAIAFFVIIIGFFVLFRLGITLPMIETAVRHFFYSSSSASLIVFGAMSNTKKKEKFLRKIEAIRRRIFQKRLQGQEHEIKERDRHA